MTQDELMALATGSLAPQWELQEPGRLKWELDWLKHFKANPQIDESALRSRAIWLHFDWVVAGESVQLTARYPDSFSRMRPKVSLRGERTNHQRHVSPLDDADICLLGRDTRQWLPDLSLALLLHEQLADALQDTGDQDPQGEPDEYWWNIIGFERSFIAIDSSWAFAEHNAGKLRVRIAVEEGRVRGWVRQIQAAGGEVLCSWSGPQPFRADKTFEVTVPWVRAPLAIRPHPALKELSEFISTVGAFINQVAHPFGNRLHGQLMAIVYPMERSVNEVGDGWLFPLHVGPPDAFVGKKNRTKQLRIVPTYRAGASDMGWRVPSVGHLRTSKVAVVGAGAIGGPLVIELARNGCGNLRVVDHDKVEPGNAIRWPLGASAWSELKVGRLHEFVKSEYPWCSFQPISKYIGDVSLGDRDNATLAMLEGVDLAIDASASFGVSTTLHDWARIQGLPMMSLWATPTVQGGGVAYYAPGGACPTCLEHYHQSGEVGRPPGQGDETALVQPPGCAERTFTGSSMDVQGVSLQAARLAVQTLANAPKDSFIQTLSLVDDAGASIPPSWRVDQLPIHPKCTCPH